MNWLVMIARKLLLALVVVRTICPTPAISQGAVVYSDKEFGFRVRYPSDWTQTETQEPIPEGSRLRLFITLTNGNEVSMCAFSVAAFDASKEYLAADIISRMMEPGLFEEVLRETMAKGRVISIQRGQFGGQDAAIALIGNTVPVRRFMINFTGVMATTVRDGQLYRGFCYSDEKTFPKMETQLRSILDSFSFIQIISTGIQDVLASMAAKQRATLPKTLDELTTLVDVRAEGNTLSYRYVLAVAKKKGMDIAGFQDSIKHTMCSLELKKLLNAGGNFNFSYEDQQSHFIATVHIQNGDCS
jgi:hypothetical protein